MAVGVVVEDEDVDFDESEEDPDDPDEDSVEEDFGLLSEEDESEEAPTVELLPDRLSVR
ncbi:hypothetical protein GCM10022247_09600 [Allokutzneria multivorans]|uniref:Uncharacterized protein n=1 Tax=Allokutzneria multivorans TaxID=1142134 RepID=A0ABP7R4M5_9PSEU